MSFCVLPILKCKLLIITPLILFIIIFLLLNLIRFSTFFIIDKNNFFVKEGQTTFINYKEMDQLKLDFPSMKHDRYVRKTKDSDDNYYFYNKMKRKNLRSKQKLTFHYSTFTEKSKLKFHRGIVLYRLVSDDDIPNEGFGVQVHNLRKLLIRERGIYERYNRFIQIIWILDRISNPTVLKETKLLLEENKNSFDQMIELSMTDNLARKIGLEDLSAEARSREMKKIQYKTKSYLQNLYYENYAFNTKKTFFSWYCILSVHHFLSMDSIHLLLNEINHVESQQKYNQITHFSVRSYQMLRPILDYESLIVHNEKNFYKKYEKRKDKFVSTENIYGRKIISGIEYEPEDVLVHRRALKGKILKYNYERNSDQVMIQKLNCYGEKYSFYKKYNCVGSKFTSSYIYVLYKYPTYFFPSFENSILSENKYVGNVETNKKKEKYNKTCFGNTRNDYLKKQTNLSFVIYRIYGNDMPPLQKKGQLAYNLEYTLKNEHKHLQGLTKKWVLNRIIDKSIQDEMVYTLEKYGYTEENGSVLIYRFNNDTFSNLLPLKKKTGYLSKKDINELLNYGQHLNEVRNKILNKVNNIEGENRPFFHWILVFDGNQFLTNEAWNEILNFAKSSLQKNTKTIQVPMCRINQPQESKWLNPNSNLMELLEKKKCYLQEPQLMFRYDSCVSYNSKKKYGKKSKLDLVNNLGCTESSSTSQSYCGSAGYTIRLFPFPETKTEDEAIMSVKDRNKRRILRTKAIQLFKKYIAHLYLWLNQNQRESELEVRQRVNPKTTLH